MPAPCVSQLLKAGHAKVDRIASSATLLDAARTMAQQYKTVMAVMRDGELEGVVTRRRLLHCLSRTDECNVGQGPVSAAMTAPRCVVGPETSLEQAMAIMDRESIGWLPVMEQGRFLGILDEREVLRGVIGALQIDFSQLQEYIEHLHQAGQD